MQSGICGYGFEMKDMLTAKNGGDNMLGTQTRPPPVNKPKRYRDNEADEDGEGDDLNLKKKEKKVI